MTNPKPKKHHYVPVCYLNKFTDDSGKIYKLHKEHPYNIKFSYPKNECNEEYYYQINESMKNKFKAMEKINEMFIESTVLHSYENPYNNLFEKITSKKRLSISQVEQFAKIIINFVIRNPYWRNNVITPAVKNLDKIINKESENTVKAEMSQYLPRSTVNEITKNVRKQFEEDPDSIKYLHHNNLIKSYTDFSVSEYVNILKGASWTLLINNNTDNPFITTDNPGVGNKINTDMIYNNYFDKGFSYFFPISPKYCLRITDAISTVKHGRDVKKEILKEKVNINIVNQINNNLVRYANKIIISNNRNYLESFKLLKTS